MNKEAPDIKGKSTVIALFVSLLMLSSSFAMVSDISDAYGTGTEGNVLFDMGNGKTSWYEAESGSTIDEVLKNTAEANGHTYDSGPLKIDGVYEKIIGDTDTGGNFESSGTTGFKSTSVWNVYRWDDSTDDKKWVSADLTETYDGKGLALAFYPSGTVPVETPEFKSSWTMIRGDAAQTGRQDNVVIPEDEIKVQWEYKIDGISGIIAAVTYVEDFIFAKFSTKNESDGEDGQPRVICFNLDGGVVWQFRFPGVNSYETSTPVIVGENIYVSSSEGMIYKFNWREGPGVLDENKISENEYVTSFGGKAFSDLTDADAIPAEAGSLSGFNYSFKGTGSLVYDSGAIYCTATNGMAYCFDLNLNLLWSRQMGGSVYYVSPTVYDDYMFAGALNGHLYVIDKADGEIIADEKIYTRTLTAGGTEFGNVSAVSVFEHESKYRLIFSVSDGRGMSSVVGGIGIYDFDPSTGELSKIFLIADKDTLGLTGNYHIPVVTDDFEGTYFVTTKGLCRISITGEHRIMNGEIKSTKGPPILINGESIYMTPYSLTAPVYEVSLDGRILSEWYSDSTVKNYGMSPIIFVGGLMVYGNDAGLIASSGTLPEYVYEPVEEKSLLQTLIEFLLIVLVILILIYVIARLVLKIRNPYRHAWHKFNHYLTGDDLRHNTKSRHKLFVMMLIGAATTVVVFIVCLCIGPTVTLSVSEMFSSLLSAISKGGKGLDYNELMVYESRLPRTIVALAVGIGLSIAGSMYQAIIRNPLVDPYIMGVSAGAGTAALAVIAFDFTFFGLFSPHSIYLTAFTAIIGGILAFGMTMLIAEKSGGASINYVLAGVVVGLAFSAFQTLMLSMAGQKVSNALSWLFGSFANVVWEQVWLVLVPVLALSLIPLVWAKEFNLVLLGEDQAQQMGLDVRRFNRIMLIMASVLTSVCVAFVGIIGFVGLVVPHVCRMVLGSDHRLVLPASIALGGALVMLADLAARMLYYGQELPVGAITTMIGVPVFAYLLIKRGRMYEG